MGVIVGIGIVIASILGAALSQQIVDEFKAWTPWIVDRLIELAVRRLNEEYRSRMNEEWRSHIDEVPGQIGKILCALSFLAGTRELDRICLRQMHGPSESSPDDLNAIRDKVDILSGSSVGIHASLDADVERVLAMKHNRWVLSAEQMAKYDLNRIWQDIVDSQDGRGLSE